MIIAMMSCNKSEFEPSTQFEVEIISINEFPVIDQIIYVNQTGSYKIDKVSKRLTEDQRIILERKINDLYSINIERQYVNEGSKKPYVKVNYSINNKSAFCFIYRPDFNQLPKELEDVLIYILSLK